MHQVKYIFFIFCLSLQAQDFAKSEIVLSTIKYNNIDYLPISEFINKHQLKSTYYDSKEKLNENPQSTEKIILEAEKYLKK